MTALHIDNSAVAELAPSEKLVYMLIQENAPVTRSDLQSQTQLPDGTITHALRTLVEQNVVRRLRDPDDLRRRIYKPVTQEQVDLTTAGPEEEPSSQLRQIGQTSR
jgi:DNA-binding MarR family transcriptional regulator